jgi:hypothetical protein
MPDSEHALIRRLEGDDGSGTEEDSDNEVPLGIRGGGVRGVRKMESPTLWREYRESDAPMILMGHGGRRRNSYRI